LIFYYAYITAIDIGLLGPQAFIATMPLYYYYWLIDIAIIDYCHIIITLIFAIAIILITDIVIIFRLLLTLLILLH